MTRKSDGSSPTAVSNRAAAPLRTLRNQIDKLDLQIVDLINRWAGLAAEIGKIKTDHGAEVLSNLTYDEFE